MVDGQAECCCVAVVGQVEKIAALSESQAWDGLQVVTDLPGRGRGVKVTRAFICDQYCSRRFNVSGTARSRRLSIIRRV